MSAALQHVGWPLSGIVVPESRKRAFDEVGAKRLAGSIAEIGLINPIAIDPDGTLVAGLHRLEACRSLGWTEIPVIVVRLDDMHRELAEIDENLIRVELTVAQRAEHLQRRKELYEILHPETRSVNVKGGPGRGKKTTADAATVSVPTFADDAAAKTGRSARVIREDVQIGETLQEDPETRKAIRGTAIEDSKTDLLELVREKDPKRRHEAVEKVKSKEVKSIREALAPEPTDAPPVDAEAPAECPQPRELPMSASFADLERLAAQRNADPEFQTLRTIQRAVVKTTPTRAQRMVDFILDGGEIALLRLGLDWTVTAESLRKAFRAASVSAHPDRGGSQAGFVELNRCNELIKTMLGGNKE